METATELCCFCGLFVPTKELHECAEMLKYILALPGSPIRSPPPVLSRHSTPDSTSAISSISEPVFMPLMNVPLAPAPALGQKLVDPSIVETVAVPLQVCSSGNVVTIPGT